MFIHIFPVNREQIESLVGSVVKPGKVVDSKYIDVYVMSVYFACNVSFFLKYSGKNVLCAENFMTASESFNLRKYVIQHFNA